LEGDAAVCKGGKWEFDARKSWGDPGFAQDDNQPVVRVDWNDATAYTRWLAEITGRPYRLLTEAEWEYVARAGTSTPFWWGSSISTNQANYDGRYVYRGGGAKGESRQKQKLRDGLKAYLPQRNEESMVAVDQFAPNPWGLYQVHGNVWEWCEDVWHNNYDGAPTDGSAWLVGGEQARRVLRGGSWSGDPWDLRAAVRSGSTTVSRGSYLGFRLGRTITP
jgi:formylglycine-generating enzyme required for sulfatase activity